MSVCTPCTKVLPIPYCAESVWIGDWSSSGVTLYVYTMNTATGQITKEETTSGSGGKIAIDFDNRVANSSYEVWINTTESQAFNKESFNLPSTSDAATCLSIRFERVTEDAAINEAKVSE